MKKIARGILRIFGWKVDTHSPEGVDKCVVVMGPHTSNWDFVIGRLAFIAFGIKGSYLIKKELFFFPLGWVLKKMGGITVGRGGKRNLTETAVSYFENNKRMFMVFTPEGTRSYSPNWKKGFYYISENANVPIYIGYMDYEKKVGGFHSLFEPTGDIEKDIQYIKNILKKYKGRFPENGIDGN